MPNSTKQTLKESKKKIRRKKNWTQGVYRDKVPTALVGYRTRYCALGALRKVDGPHEVAAQRALSTACYELYGCGIAVTNDGKGHRAIMKAFNQAIKNA